MASSEILTRIHSITAPGNRVTELKLGSNNIGDDGARALAQAIQSTHCSLTYLNLYHNNIGDDGARALAQAIQSTHCSLTTLKLNSNKIGDDGARALAQAIQSTHCSLTSLNLYNNNIGDAGARALAQAIQSTHCSLTSLDLNSNKIGDDGARALAQAIQSTHCSLTDLDLYKNNIGDAGARAFADALKHNRLVTTMDLVLGYNSFISWEFLGEIETYLQRNQKLRDDFLSMVKLAVGHDDHLAKVVAAMDEDITPSAHQRYALIQMIKSAGEEDLPQEQRAQYLAMIQWLLHQGVPVNGDVLRAALETRQEDIIRLVKSAPAAVGAAGLVRRSLQAAAASAMKKVVPSSWFFKKSSQTTEAPAHTQAGSSAAEVAEATPVISSSEQATVKVAEAAAVEPSPVEPPTSPAPIVPHLNNQVTQLTEADATFITHLRTHSANLATTDQLASLYLKGEQGAEDINTVLRLRQMIAADGTKQQLYEDLQLQLNAIIRAIQQANITYSDRATVSGKNWMEYFSQYAKDAAAISKATSIVFGVGEYLYDTYRENKFQARCKRVANLQGDGDQDIRLLSEALSRHIVLDDALLGTPKLQDSVAGKKSPWLDTSALKPSKMEDRLAKNRFMEQAPRVLKISSLVLTCIFDNDAFDNRQEVNVTLVDKLHQLLRVEVGLSAQVEAPTPQAVVVTAPVVSEARSPLVAPTPSASLTATMPASTSDSAFDGAAMMAMMQKMQELMSKLERENQSLKSKLPQDDVEVSGGGGGGGQALAQVQAQSQSSASKTGQGMASNPLAQARDIEDLKEAVGGTTGRLTHIEAMLGIPSQAAEEPNPEQEAQAEADRRALFSP